MLRSMMASVASVVALTGIASAQTAPANEAPTTPEPSAASTDGNVADRTVYEAAFYARFNPQNALDMVNQTPNFALNGGDTLNGNNANGGTVRRGFSGAVGNLLIDGRRPVAKSQSVQTILQQIPASQVVRIELLRGAAVAGDASGQSVLINVVRVPSAGSGVYTLGGEYNEKRFAPQSNASWSGRAGDIDYGLGLNYNGQFRAQPGYRRLFDGTGNQTGRVLTPEGSGFRDWTVNGNLAFSLFGGRLTTTEQFDAWHFHDHNGYFFFDNAETPTKTLRNTYNEHQWSFEIGANYDRDIGPWSLALVSLLNRKYYDNREFDTDFDGAGNFSDLIHQAQHRNAGESILRGSIARDVGAHHFEIGAEGAINTLDAKLDLSENDGLGPLPIFVPNANVNIEERRDETFVDYTWRPDSAWSVEARLAREGSTLKFTGDSNQSVHLEFAKPSIQVARSFGSNDQLRLRFYRDVGQLNFDDFVSATSVADNRIAGGNPNLRPQTAYRLEFGGDLSLPFGAALTFAFTHHWIKDTADVVEVIVSNPDQDPLNPDDDFIRFDAPGNIGDATANSLTTHFTMPFSPLIPGAKITFDGTFWNTRVTDPITGRRRSISGQVEDAMNGEFRQDLNDLKFAWGIDYQVTSSAEFFRHDETDSQWQPTDVDLFLESTIVPGLKFRATFADVTRAPIKRQRNFYTPDRGGVLVRQEHRERIFDDAPWIVLSVSGTF